MYVRCPVIRDQEDLISPRYFVLGYLKSVNEFAQTAEVGFNDLHNAKRFYDFALEKTQFALQALERCPAPSGAIARWRGQSATVLAVDTKTSDDDPFYKYYIRTSDGAIAEVMEHDIALDFTKMDFDPLLQLINYEFHQPTWYLNRLVVSNTTHALNNAVFGFKVLAGCRAFLLPHQIVTIIRCLESPPIRYMLADEVGLGKTIEACSIVKILKEQDSRLRVAYVIPDSLVDQWSGELLSKFRINVDIFKGSRTSTNHVIIPMSKLQKYHDRTTSLPDMLIVDETHRLLANPEDYNTILRISREIQHVLLLSATPIQDRKQEFLRLLVLLNPDLYGNMPLETFSDMVDKQSRIQQRIYSVLGEIDDFESYHSSVKKRLAVIAKELKDTTLMELVNTIDETEQGQKLARHATAYICEHYRLERRVVRNRRQMLREKMPERHLIELAYTPGTDSDGYDEASALEQTFRWLRSLDASDPSVLRDTIKPVMSAAFSSPWALQRELRRAKANDYELKGAVEQWVWAAEREMSQLQWYLDENPDRINGRLLRTVDFLEQEGLSSSESAKVVIFSAFTDTLTRLAAALRERLGESAVTMFTRDMERDKLQVSADEFQSSADCRVMLCDETGGEGRNLQFARMVIHLDLPWTPNALEQRIGRLDRLGRPVDEPVISVVTYTRDTFEEKLFKLWHEGMSIFTQSLSGLEIISGEVSRRIDNALQEDVLLGLDYAHADIINLMHEMRDAVEDEQLYDAAAMLYRPLTRTIEQMLDAYQGKEDAVFSRTMLTWASQAGLVPSYNHSENLFAFSETKFSANAAVNSMLLPPKWSSYTDILVPRRRDERKITGTFCRELAIRREDILFFAPGDTIFDTVVDNAMSCGRGRSCALSVSANFSFEGIVIVWNVEPQISVLLKAGVSLQLLSQFRAFLPMDQIFTAYPLDEESRSVSATMLRDALLGGNFDANKATHLGKRRPTPNGEGSLAQFAKQFPRRTWEELVNRAHKACKKKAREELKAAADLETALQEAQRIVDAHEASCAYFGRGHEDNTQLRNTYIALLDSLSKARLVVDSAAYIKLNKVNADG
jgi:superfamily II DNA or RNA helicase